MGKCTAFTDIDVVIVSNMCLSRVKSTITQTNLWKVNKYIHTKVEYKGICTSLKYFLYMILNTPFTLIFKVSASLYFKHFFDYFSY